MTYNYKHVSTISINVGDLVQTTEEYDPFCIISGKVIEDYGNKIIMIDDDAETEDNKLEFHKSDLKIKEIQE